MINFRPLDAGVVRSLAARHLDEVTERMQARYAKTLTIREDVIDHLVAEGFSREYGARELRRTIERLVDSPLSELVLSARTADWPGFHVRLDGDRILIEPA
jgi:ATP-dependent Clp protease ATP-binding subunit ClpA